MPLPSEVRRIYNALINSGAIRYGVYPDLAADITLTGAKAWAYGAWVQIVAAVTVTVDSWLVGTHLNAAAIDDYQVQVGSGAGAAEVGLAAFPFNGTDRSGGYFPFPFPVLIVAATRIAARTANAAAGVANTIDGKVEYAFSL